VSIRGPHCWGSGVVAHEVFDRFVACWWGEGCLFMCWEGVSIGVMTLAGDVHTTYIALGVVFKFICYFEAEFSMPGGRAPVAIR
jgi:hypothetical protein